MNLKVTGSSPVIHPSFSLSRFKQDKDLPADVPHPGRVENRIVLEYGCWRRNRREKPRRSPPELLSFTLPDEPPQPESRDFATRPRYDEWRYRFMCLFQAFHRKAPDTTSTSAPTLLRHRIPIPLLRLSIASPFLHSFLYGWSIPRISFFRELALVRAPLVCFFKT